MGSRSAADSPERFEFEFDLSDRELARAWVREHFARQPLVRRALAPAFLVLGVVWLARAAEGGQRAMGLLAVAFGAYLILRPFLEASRAVRLRRAVPRGEHVHLVFDAVGLTLYRASKSLHFPWKEVTAAGLRDDYVWYEVRGAHRATIPLRVVDQRAEFEAFLRSKTSWKG